MANVAKISANDSPISENLLGQIKSLCLENPQNELAVWIKNKIDRATIPMQMDKDLLRRLTDPACNPLDFRFDLPINLGESLFEKPDNRTLIELDA